MLKRRYLFETQKTLKMAMPLIVAQMLQTSVITVDSIMAGHDSDLTLASVAIGVLLWDCAFLLMVGICLVVSPMVAHAYGAKDGERLRYVFHQGIWLALGVGLVVMVLTWQLHHILTFAKVDSNIIPHAKDYLFIMAFSMPFNALFLAPRYLNEGVGNTKVLMFLTMASIPINVIGNYITLNGLLGLPKMGASGVAISSVVSIVFMCALMWLYLFKSDRFKQYRLFDCISPLNIKEMRSMLKLGIPIAITLLMEVGLFAAITVLSGRFGSSMTAANQIALNYVSLTFMVPLGIGMTLTARIGMAVGQGRYDKAQVIGISGMIIGTLSMCLSVIVILFFASGIARLYTDDANVIAIASGLLGIAAIFQVPDGIQVCAAGSLRGLRDTKWPMIFAILGYWLMGVPLAYYFGIAQEEMATGLWKGLVIGLSFAAVLGSLRFYFLSSSLKRSEQKL